MAAEKKKRTLSSTLVWIILGLLMLSLAGFGITGFSGGASSVGSVGDERITANAYSRALQREISAQVAQTRAPVSFADLSARGVDRAVLEGLVARAALAHETRRIGLSVGDAEVARQLRETSGLLGPDGTFDRAGYEFALRQAGLSSAEFEADLREDVARSILQLALVGAVAAPEVFVQGIAAYQTETRDFTYLRLTEADLPAPLAAPDEDQIAQEYRDNAAAFTLPEARQITYAWITPAMIMDSVTVNDDALRDLYQARIAEFVQPERRLLERIVYPDAEAARAARAELDAGRADFDDLLEARGLTLEDVDMGEVAREDLSPEAAEAVFAPDAPEVIGPVQSALGPAIFRINAVLNATEVSFEEARADLRIELATDAARREIDAQRDAIDDLLAGGALLEEVARDTDMQLGTITWRGNAEDAIAGYDAFREAAARIEEGDFPQLGALSDGGLFALRLDAILPETLPPLDEIRDQVAASWRAGELARRLEARAQELAAQMATGATLDSLGGTVTAEVLIRRQDFIPDLPPALVGQVFALADEGSVAVVAGADQAVIARLDRINPGQIGSPGTDVLIQLVEVQAAQSIAQDLFEAFGRALQADVGISLNPTVINAVHTNFP